MATSYACRHTCTTCRYVVAKVSDRDKHEKTIRAHSFCNESCEQFKQLKKPTLQLNTPETFSSFLEARPTPPITRKRSRDPSPKEDSEEELRRTAVERMNVIGRIKMCCILDPARVEKCYEDVEDSVYWVEVRLSEDAVNGLLNCEELKGFVFRHPKMQHTVRMFDWVSTR